MDTYSQFAPRMYEKLVEAHQTLKAAAFVATMGGSGTSRPPPIALSLARRSDVLS
jgi:hypothetical protein